MTEIQEATSLKLCRFCAESIKAKAVICRFCNNACEVSEYVSLSEASKLAGISTHEVSVWAECGDINIDTQEGVIQYLRSDVLALAGNPKQRDKIHAASHSKDIHLSGKSAFLIAAGLMLLCLYVLQIETTNGSFMVPGYAFVDGRDLKARLTVMNVNVWDAIPRQRVVCTVPHGNRIRLLDARRVVAEDRFYFRIASPCQGWLPETFVGRKQRKPIGNRF